MKKLFAVAALAASSMLMNSSAIAVFSPGSTLSDTLSGTGCIAGASEYADTVFKGALDGASDALLKVYGVLEPGDTITHTVTYTFNEDGETIPAACDGVNVTVDVTDDGFNMTTGDASLLTGVSLTATVNGTDVIDGGNIALNQMGDLTLTLTGTVANPVNPDDLATEFAYTQDFTVSVAASK